VVVLHSTGGGIIESGLTLAGPYLLVHSELRLASP
jgi:hypothetical protein